MKRNRVVLWQLALLLGLLAPTARADTLWRIGLEDGAKAEFAAAADPASYSVPPDWNTRTRWPEWRGRSDGHYTNPASLRNLDCTIEYTLSRAPDHGAEFHFKTINASSHVPELAVFSNGFLCGVIQMIGPLWFNPDNADDWKFGDLYRVYIPKAFLRAGANTLRIRKLGHPFSANTTNRMTGGNLAYLSFDYDYLKLVSLQQPAAEPIHSRYVSLCAQGSAGGGFNINQNSLTYDPMLLRWLGCAYSGNTQRATFWRGVSSQQPKRREYLQMLRDLNMTVLMGHYSNVSESQLVNGDLSTQAKRDITNFFSQYGSWFQLYELSNEPCYGFSNESLAGMQQVARHVRAIRPGHVEVVAPGYAYGGGSGTPIDWDKSSTRRAGLEALCEATNGHAYGNSYRASAGGSFFETLRTFNGGRFPNGFPKPFINSEFGTPDGDDTENNDIALSERRASLFDRIGRAHIAFASRSVYYSFWGNNGDHGIIQGVYTNPLDWRVRVLPGAPTETPKFKILRQHVLAYATHGQPLTYIHLDPAGAQNRLLYFRAVDTSGVGPLPGTGATSNKILLNFVNFDNRPGTLHVRVTMPLRGVYAGERFGAHNEYRNARSTVILATRLPRTLDLSVTLGPRDSVQYILERTGAEVSVAAKTKRPASHL